MPKSDVSSWYGWVPDRPDHRDKLYAAIAAPPKTLPAKTDLRNGCSAVENQGKLGSCTANALAGNLEFLEKKAGHAATNLSRLFIYYNERAMEGTINDDVGAVIRDGVRSLVKLGVCAEKKWPYKLSKFAQKPPAACYTEAQDHQVTSYHRILSLHEMKQCLAEGYPFVFGFSVYMGFESPEVAKTGELNLPGPNEPGAGPDGQPAGHAVMAVGYDDTTKRVSVRNSWGTDWGIQGYFTMPYDYIADKNLADDFWTLRAFENQ
jgi:C1A family cysteine protease